MSQVTYKDRLGTDCSKWDGCEEKFGDKNLLPPLGCGYGF